MAEPSLEPYNSQLGPIFTPQGGMGKIVESSQLIDEWMSRVISANISKASFIRQLAVPRGQGMARGAGDLLGNRPDKIPALCPSAHSPGEAEIHE